MTKIDVSLLLGSDELGWQELGKEAVLGKMTKTMPGGDGALEWSLAGDAAWKYRNVLVPGARVRLSVNGERIFGGRFVGDPLRHRLNTQESIECIAGGLSFWLARHKGFAIPFIDADYQQWLRTRTRYDSGAGELESIEDTGKFTVDTEGRLYIKAEKDRTYDDYANARLWYWLFGGTDLGYDIVGIDFDYKCYIPTDWEFRIRSAADPWVASSTAEWTKDASESSWTAKSLDLASPNKCVGLHLIWNSTGSTTPTTAPYVWLKNVKIYFRTDGGVVDRTIDLGTAMGDVASQSGFATVVDCDALTGAFGELMVRPDFPKTAMDTLRELAGMCSDFVEYGFFLTPADEDAFYARLYPAAIDSKTNTAWSYGGRPGEDAASLTRDADMAPDYLRLLYRSSGVTTIPNKTKRDVWHPSAPGSFAENADVVTDYADTQIDDASAAAFAARLWTIRQAQQWTGEIPFGDTALASSGVEQPSWRLRPGDRVSVPSLESANNLYVAGTAFDFSSMAASATIGWPFENRLNARRLQTRPMVPRHRLPFHESTHKRRRG